MAITYTWTATNLSTLNTDYGDDYVVDVEFTVVGTEDSYSYTMMGFKSFEVKAVENFTPFTELTNDLVVGWIKADMTAEGTSFYETKISEEIDAQKNPTPTPISRRAPWLRGNRPF